MKKTGNQETRLTGEGHALDFQDNLGKVRKVILDVSFLLAFLIDRIAGFGFTSPFPQLPIQAAITDGLG